MISSRLSAISAYHDVDKKQRQLLKQKVDSELFTLSKAYAGLIQKRKQVKQRILHQKQDDLTFEKQLVNSVLDIKKFASYLDFETTGSIKMTSIG